MSNCGIFLSQQVLNDAHNLRKFPIVETFLSIEGEGIRTGMPVVFVRFAGCNLRCSYCDTNYSYTIDENTVFMTLEELDAKILSYNCNFVTFTGGEPLIYREYIRRFAQNHSHIQINIETNGSMNIEDLTEANIFVTMDYKCPSSFMEDMMDMRNLYLLNETDVVKFVVGSETDLTRVKEICKEYQILANIYLSPVFGKMDLKRLAEFVIENKDLNFRLGLQIHKFIWDPNARGV